MSTTPIIFQTMICLCYVPFSVYALGIHDMIYWGRIWSPVSMAVGGTKHTTSWSMKSTVVWKHAGSIRRLNFFRSVSADNGKRPGFEARGIFEDVIITSPLSSQCTVQNASIQGRAAAAAERIKNARYQADCSAADVMFLPFAFETYDRWGDSFMALRTQVLTKEHWSTTGGDVSQWLYRSLSRQGYSHGWVNSTLLHSTTKATGPVRLLIRVYFVTNLSNIT